MDSIIQKEKECFVCHSQRFLELHHCMHGTANRKIADRLGLVIWLCPYCHRGKSGVHQNADLDMMIKKIAEQAYLDYYHANIDDWIRQFGKNYL